MSPKPRSGGARGKRSNRTGWKLEDAKARFSEVIRRARTEGPQRVTVRGQDAVVIVAAEEFQRLVPPEKPRLTFTEFLQGLDFDGLTLERERDLGREVSF